MLIVGDNLKYLMKQHDIIDNPNNFDHTSIALGLGKTIIHMEQLIIQMKQLFIMVKIFQRIIIELNNSMIGV